jgi:hypothetical protein
LVQSIGAAAGLIASVERPDVVRTIVSRGGRPDLAGSSYLKQVRAPTLLILGNSNCQIWHIYLDDPNHPSLLKYNIISRAEIDETTKTNIKVV